MKSKYAPLVRLKKENLEEARRMLLASNQHIQTIQELIKQIQHDLYACEKPLTGNLQDYNRYTLMTATYRRERDKSKNDLAIAFHKHNEIQDLLNKALIEFEKFQYLQAQEEKEYMKKIKQQEAQYLDEIAVIGYNRQKANK
ncbi:MAG: flagellar FliJ family protein [Thiovulaceae bacterium]|nr:flagellar FliJ family protein [Sulfurimonadaceae bacterium]